MLLYIRLKSSHALHAFAKAEVFAFSLLDVPELPCCKASLLLRLAKDGLILLLRLDERLLE